MTGGVNGRARGGATGLAAMETMCRVRRAHKCYVLLDCSRSNNRTRAFRAVSHSPVLMLAGEMDGMARWPWQAPYLGELAAMAAKFGPG